MLSDAKKELAKAKMMLASSLPTTERATLYKESDDLISEFLAEEEIDDKLPAPHYFAAHSYLEAAKLTKDNAKIDLLDKAISIARKGKTLPISSDKKAELLEPIGIALGEKAKFYGKTSPQFASVLAESTGLFEEGFKAGDTLAAYNIAVNYTLLENAENAKKWLETIAAKGGMDKQICRDGLLLDPDLDWLRKNQLEWLKTFFRTHCAQFLPTSPLSFLRSVPGGMGSLGRAVSRGRGDPRGGRPADRV